MPSNALGGNYSAPGIRFSDRNQSLPWVGSNSGLLGSTYQPYQSTMSSVGGNYGTYNKAVEQNATDYGNIMGLYGNLLNDIKTKAPMLAPSAGYAAKKYDYNPTADVTSSLSTLSGLTRTGGLNPNEIADIRARGISPIASIYSSAQRDIERNRALKGGYSPGYAAVKAKMARELSDTLSNKSREVEADIADRLQRGRLSSAPAYASAAGAENALQSQYGAANAQAENEASRFNATLPLQYQTSNLNNVGQQANIVDAMRSLYGTTPANAALYGTQAQNAAQLQDQFNNSAVRQTSALADLYDKLPPTSGLGSAYLPWMRG